MLNETFVTVKGWIGNFRYFIIYLQHSVKAWQKGSDGREEDLIFKGGLGAGRKSNPGGLPALTVIGKIQ
jgi:hypothetical protein